MDSEESRPGSSASNSSSNSSDNSRPSSPSALNEDGELAASKSPRPRSIASPQSSNGRRSRPRSRSSNEDEEVVQSPPQSPPLSLHSPCSQSKSDSESGGSSSSSSSDENEPEDAKSAGSGAPVKSKTSSERSSSEGSFGGIANTRQSAESRQQSASPANSHHSSRNSRNSRNSGNSRISRNSSASSLRSRSISPARNIAEETGINISHEDLSDVSDMESEKRVASPANSKQSLPADDDGTNSPAVVQAALECEEHTAGLEKESQRRYSPNRDDDNSQTAEITDLRQKLDQKKNQYKQIMEKDTSPTNVASGSFSNGKVQAVGESLVDFVKTQDEDALDFEAEEGECQEMSKDENEKQQQKRLTDGNEKGDADAAKKMGDNKSDGEAEDGEELEEGEVSDEDEKRPEETEPKPVCRFYTRGQCTWGMSCRFLHPGVTDKGNYTMFDLVRPVPVPSANPAGSRGSSYAPHAADYHDYRTDRPPLHHRTPLHHPATAAYAAHHEPRAALPDGPVVVESAWERGLRTAKEMMRKANKRKEQDMDFEDKKMNLTLSPDELEKDPYYLKERVSPPEVVAPPPYGRHAAPYQDVPPAMYSQPERFGRGPPLPLPPYDDVDPYGRNMRYRELPPHRMPQYEDERRVRPTREVIVQRVPEPVGRGDEWNDPWMRSKSPGGRGGSRERGPGDKRRRDRRSYSSNSSYSSSSSSQSDSSSESSRSPTPTDHRRRYNSGPHKSPPPPPPGRRHAMRAARSPSPAARRARLSPSLHLTPPAKRGRGHISPPTALGKRSAYSPAAPHKRKRTPPNLKKITEKIKAKRHHSSSSSGSSDTSASDSESDSGSSSSESSSRSKERTPPKRNRLAEKVAHVDRKLIKKVVEPPKKRSPISIEIKKQATVGTSALAVSPTHSVSSEKDTKKSRREELLKQLRAVEDAIAKKRSKLA